MSNQVVARLTHRLLSLIGCAKLTLSNDDGPIQKVQGKFSELETIDGIPRAIEFGFTSRLPEGTDLVVAFLNGDRSNGVVIGTNHQGSRPKGLKPGESMLYSLLGQYIHLSTTGIEVEAKGLPVTIKNASSVLVESKTTVTLVAPAGVEMETPTLKVSGDIIDNSGTNTASMAQMRALYDDHDHGGVVRGSADTYKPNQKMGG